MSSIEHPKRQMIRMRLRVDVTNNILVGSLYPFRTKKENLMEAITRQFACKSHISWTCNGKLIQFI